MLNISAMSFGALSANAIRALNKGARLGHFAHDTGEGSISRYHRELGSGYFGCRKIPVGVDCISPARHSAFSTPIELLEFIVRLRELSGGKPVGFKFSLGHPWEFFGICKAMMETGVAPDFIVVDGGEGGTGAAPIEFTDHIGTPLQEALMLVHNTLVGLNLRDQVRIGASAKIISGFDVARTLALGADWVQLGARIHVRARLHSIPALPYRLLPDRGHHPGSASPTRARGRRQGSARLQFPPQYAACAQGIDRRGRTDAPLPIRAASHRTPRFSSRNPSGRQSL